MYGMGYPPYPQYNSPGDIIVGKIIEKWWDDQSKKKNDDKDDKEKEAKKLAAKFKEVLLFWTLFWASTPLIVGSWYLIGWSIQKIFAH